MRYQRPKGTADILPGESAQWEAVEKLAREIFARYGYREIRTPIFENYNIFARSAGETSDVVTKEMYDFKDKGDRHVALRPEGTAGVVRAYVENKLYGPEYNKPYKVYYMGPMFRYERPQRPSGGAPQQSPHRLFSGHSQADSQTADHPKDAVEARRRCWDC